MLEKLGHGKNVQKCQWAKWLTEEEFESFESNWESPQQIREKLNEKPKELKRYEDKLGKAIFNDNKAERFRK